MNGEQKFKKLGSAKKKIKLSAKIYEPELFSNPDKFMKIIPQKQVNVKTSSSEQSSNLEERKVCRAEISLPSTAQPSMKNATEFLTSKNTNKFSSQKKKGSQPESKSVWDAYITSFRAKKLSSIEKLKLMEKDENTNLVSQLEELNSDSKSELMKTLCKKVMPDATKAISARDGGSKLEESKASSAEIALPSTSELSMENTRGFLTSKESNKVSSEKNEASQNTGSSDSNTINTELFESLDQLRPAPEDPNKYSMPKNERLVCLKLGKFSLLLKDIRKDENLSFPNVETF